MQLRDYQIACLDRSLEYYKSGINRQLAVMATGTGKTAVASSLRTHHGFGKKILFLVHMEPLAVQAATAMQKWNPDLRCGVEMAGSYVDMDGLYPPTFIVASVPTLGRKGSDRIKRFDPFEFDAVIQDEAHIGIADSFKRVYDHFGLLTANPYGPLFLGITATPNRSDGKGLGELFDVIVFDMGIQKGIADGWLCDLVGYRVNGKAKLDGVHTRAGDFAQDELESAVNTPERNAIIVKEWYKVAYGKRTLAFTVDVQHALDLAAAFTAHGEPAEAVWGDDPDRHKKIRGHKMGEFNILCNCNVLGIGYDDPQIQCIISAAPTKSELRYVQQVGRGTRICEGKTDCVLEGTLVLTDHGLIPIEQVSVMMNVWDGQNFVAHDGPVCKGVREVIEYDGLVATPDHRVWTRMGWKTLAVCKLQGIALWRGELGGEAIKVPAHNESKCTFESGRNKGDGASGVPKVRRNWILGCSIFSRGKGWVSSLRESSVCSEMAPKPLRRNQAEVYQFEAKPLQGLWREGHQILIRFSNRLRRLHNGEFRTGPQQADRQDKQRRELRAGKSASIDSPSEYGAQAEHILCGIPPCIPRPLPRGEVCGFYAKTAFLQRTLFLGNSGAMENPIMQTKGRVWDILNAGPLHRFTASGFIVSNCTVIDVVDNCKKHSLTTISTLLGLPKDLDLKGEKYSKARERLERMAAEFPTANIQDIKSLNDLKSIAENIQLFQPNYPPEIARLSELGWRKSAEGYMLAVNRDLVTITKDLREEWQIRGKVGEAVADFSAQNLPGAMNIADRFVLEHGGIKPILARDSRWHHDPPTEKQLGLARVLKIVVPPGTTKGQLSHAIDVKMMEKRRA